jgi:hypothetical protein
MIPTLRNAKSVWKQKFTHNRLEPIQAPACRNDDIRTGFSKNGRGERIRTSDPLVPNQVLAIFHALP